MGSYLPVLISCGTYYTQGQRFDSPCRTFFLPPSPLSYFRTAPITAVVNIFTGKWRLFQSRRCHCTGCMSRAQVMSTRIEEHNRTSHQYRRSGITRKSGSSSASRRVIGCNRTGRRWSGGRRRKGKPLPGLCFGPRSYCYGVY
ncbi:hypothetical protein J6590_019158 [Homalodisca vitripennis]|nr:hypothetical protein J6590_019158 [Homalodisca vitripennis]